MSVMADARIRASFVARESRGVRSGYGSSLARRRVLRENAHVIADVARRVFVRLDDARGGAAVGTPPPRVGFGRETFGSDVHSWRRRRSGAEMRVSRRVDASSSGAVGRRNRSRRIAHADDSKPFDRVARHAARVTARAPARRLRGCDEAFAPWCAPAISPRCAALGDHRACGDGKCGEEGAGESNHRGDVARHVHPLSLSRRRLMGSHVTEAMTIPPRDKPVTSLSTSANARAFRASRAARRLAPARRRVPATRPLADVLSNRLSPRWSPSPSARETPYGTTTRDASRDG